MPQFALHEDFDAVREKYIAAFHNVLLAAAGANVSQLKLFSTQTKFRCQKGEQIYPSVKVERDS